MSCGPLTGWCRKVPGCGRCHLAMFSAPHRLNWSKIGPVPDPIAAKPPRVPQRPAPPCVYLGEPTGGSVGCRSCATTSPQPLYHCGLFGLTVIGDKSPKSDTVKACRWCPARATAADPLAPPLRLVPVGPGLAARPDGYAFNGGLTRWRGRLLLAHRDGWAGSDIHVAELGDDYRVLRSTRLALAHPRAAVGREDPRLFDAGGELGLHFTGVERVRGRIRTSQLHARLGDDLAVRSVHCPELVGRQEPMEKNWSPFWHDGEHLAVYQTGPRHVIVRITGDRAERVADTPVNFPWSGGVLRGGAPPVRVGDHYYHWFHGRTGPARSPTYNVGLAVFEARHPFRVVALSPRPMLWASAADNAAHPHPNYCAVAFPGGAVPEDGVWKVSMGWNDRGVRVAEWDAAAVDAALARRPGNPGA